MHTIELLQSALQVAESLGYGIRHEWMGGATGGLCEIAGRRWLFVDESLNAVDRLDQVANVLLQDVRIHSQALPPGLSDYLGLRRAA